MHIEGKKVAMLATHGFGHLEHEIRRDRLRSTARRSTDQVARSIPTSYNSIKTELINAGGQADCSQP